MNSNSLNQAKSRFLDGIKFFNEENYELAEKNFLESLNLAPKRLSVISNLIKIYVITKQFQKLDEILTKYKDLNNNKEILFGEAYSFFFKENHRNPSFLISNKHTTQQTVQLKKIFFRQLHLCTVQSG